MTTSFYLPPSSYISRPNNNMNTANFGGSQLSHNNPGNPNNSATTNTSPYYLTVQAPQALNSGVEHQQPPSSQSQSHHQQQPQQVILQQPSVGNGWNVPSDKRGGHTSPLGYPSQGNPNNGAVALSSPFNNTSFQSSQPNVQEAKPVLPPRSMLDQSPPPSLSMNHSSIVSPFSQSLSSQSPNDVSNLMVPNRSSTSRTVANTKRAAQNRAAQRAFRQRKDRYIKDLEQKAKELDSVKKQNEALIKEVQEKAATISNLKSQLARYKAEIDYSDDDLRRNSNASPYSSNNDDDSRGFDEEPCNGGGSNNHHSEHSFFEKESNKSPYPFSPTSSDGSPPQSSLNRPGSGLTENPPRGSGVILPPGPNTDSTIDPYYRSDYRHSNHLNSSQNIAPILHQNVVVVPGEEDTDRVMVDDLCELLRTRSRPTIPHNLGMGIWTPTNQGTQSGVNGSGTVVS
ncbi:7641_t:CDS:2 [Ambispora gerdemannii]|uniref:7641_t:CDS:1 n=1 Tax=Ambispora gerdemannii TaxID=144530 RepID=A0A9N9A3M0_9GLOM|nr:7641_t:CDS:2 [Ambispora gerdemannii]